MVEINKSNRRGLHCKKEYFFRIRLIDSSQCPDYKINRTNPLTEMSEEYRLKELVEILGNLWEETQKENIKIN